MNSSNKGVTQAEKAGKLWRQGNYLEARHLYEEALTEATLPLDKAKLLANISQIYEKEESLSQAINTAEEALKIINNYKLYESLEGSHLRGYLNGFINRAKGKSCWATLEYDESIPLEMNLSPPDRIRTHFSIAIIAAGLSGTIGSQVPIMRLEVLWTNGSICVYSIIGFIFGWAATSKLLEQAVISLCMLRKKTIRSCLRPAVNLLTLIAFVYLIMMPFLLKELLSTVARFAISGSLGIIFFAVFFLHRHCKRID